MRILIANKFEQSGIDGLKALGCDVTYQPDLADEALAQALASGGAGALIVRSTKVTEAMMAPTLRLIVRAGAGVNTIDVKAATARGISVANCPGKNAIAVAELVFGLLLSIDRRIPDNVADLRAGKWNKKEYSKARGLFGATLGVLGVGSIGREVIRRAAAFGMPIVLWSRHFDRQDRRLTASEAEELDLDLARHEADLTLAPSPAEVARRSDVLTIHLALGPETRKLVNADVLSRLKPGSIVINTARGEIVDYGALTEAIRARHLRVGLDVFAQEPAQATGEFLDPIVREAGVYGTHHIGASTDQAQDAIAAETVRIVQAFIETGKAPNAVN
jgi:D-3-phosphoglycerate dehydrogenase / 2-oxoglutarate reductase